MNSKITRIEEVYENTQVNNPRYEGFILQLIRFKNDPKEENNCYYKIIRKSEQPVAASYTWNYIASWEFERIIFKEGWKKVK